MQHSLYCKHIFESNIYPRSSYSLFSWVLVKKKKNLVFLWLQKTENNQMGPACPQIIHRVLSGGHKAGVSYISAMFRSALR